LLEWNFLQASISVATGGKGGSCPPPTGHGLDSVIRANPMRSVNT